MWEGERKVALLIYFEVKMHLKSNYTWLTVSQLAVSNRVSLTYRVKSAHKIKLTDNQLLQWMTPILLIMIIYLGAWTVSDPPVGEDVTDGNGLIFKQCTYDWWDHVLAIGKYKLRNDLNGTNFVLKQTDCLHCQQATVNSISFVIGEMVFLFWGVKVSLDVRKAESFFDEAKCISWAVYNITITNVIMASFQWVSRNNNLIRKWKQWMALFYIKSVFILPDAGPDLKYFFGFVRTQLSTTTTIALVFGPKVIWIDSSTFSLTWCLIALESAQRHWGSAGQSRSSQRSDSKFLYQWNRNEWRWLSQTRRWKRRA